MQDYILVDLQVVPEASSGGILLPTVNYDFDEKNEEAFVAPKPRAGTVVAVGPGARTSPILTSPLTKRLTVTRQGTQ